MEEEEILQSEQSATAEKDAVDRAFGAENRNRLIDRYFDTSASDGITPTNAWQHVYRLLLWSDPTTGLAHCYESDKSQPGKPWYARSLAFHEWVCSELGTGPDALGHEIDWLFIRACADLAEAMLRRETRLTEVAAEQRLPYQNRGFPEPGADPELAAIIQDTLRPYLAQEPQEEIWREVTQRVRQFLAVQNKRKNLVGEGFEDVLAQVVRRACDVHEASVRTRSLLYEIPGFNRARQGGKENKVDLAVIRPSMRTLVTAKWSVRADREKQFPTEYDEYINAESESRKFQYVFVTNEFDPARLMRACENLHRNSLMFDYVVHINTNAVRATYGDLSRVRDSAGSSRRRVIEHIDAGRLISLEQWLAALSDQ
ncbi:hypothetical protein [Rhizobium leguminosarum]|uniref:hypothetical protein n=1 Tax=Rhizobium leguminosarum TaxID=384 RepID=UPI00103893D8|nr:hypothetical protein [Rhizobium leguminosarum]TBY86214.1 hypothetical protein E0H32_03255 [Rhizobium leguminosarum bv. viciae]